MTHMVCLETDEGEVFVNLGQICQAVVTTETVHVQYADGHAQTFTGPAAHALIQALRHLEKRTSQLG